MNTAIDSIRIPRSASGPAERGHPEADDVFAGTWVLDSPEEAMSAELARAARFRQPVTLVLVELDAIGQEHFLDEARQRDAVMAELTRRMRAAVRTSDIVFRWHPLKLMLLATGSGYRSGERLAESVRRAVATPDFPGVGPLTISLGVAEPVANESAAALFLRLEQLLERTRDTGPGRVVVDHRGNSDDFASATGSMPLKLVWLEAYESGHPQIDSQHRHLFELANALIDAAFGRNENPGRATEILDALFGHLQRHFSAEEALLERLAYGRLAQQKAAHVELLARAVALHAQAREGSVPFGVLLEFVCRDVLARHVLADDRHYFPLVAAEGARQR